MDRRTIRRSATLGGFILMVLVGLTAATLKLKDITLFASTTNYTVVFGKDSEVSEGARVFTSGVKIGTVKKVGLLPVERMKEGGFVWARIAIKDDVTLWSDAKVVLARATLLGSYRIELDRGTPGSGPFTDDYLVGGLEPDVMAELAKFVEENRDTVSSLLARADNAVGKFDEIATDLKGTTDKHESGDLGYLLLGDETMGNLQRITDRVDQSSSSKDSLRIVSLVFVMRRMRPDSVMRKMPSSFFANAMLRPPGETDGCQSWLFVSVSRIVGWSDAVPPSGNRRPVEVVALRTRDDGRADTTAASECREVRADLRVLVTGGRATRAKQRNE